MRRDHAELQQLEEPGLPYRGAEARRDHAEPEALTARASAVWQAGDEGGEVETAPPGVERHVERGPGQGPSQPSQGPSQMPSQAQGRSRGSFALRQSPPIRPAASLHRTRERLALPLALGHGILVV